MVNAGLVLLLAGVLALWVLLSRRPEPFDTTVAPAIIGGSAISTLRYPWLCKVWTATEPCTGMLIAPRVVLTAGHCKKTKVGVVTFPKIDPKTNKLVTRVGQWHRHPEYKTVNNSQGAINDIAFILLKDPIIDVAPLKLASKLPKDLALVTVLGTGFTKKIDPAKPKPSKRAWKKAQMRYLTKKSFEKLFDLQPDIASDFDGMKQLALKPQFLAFGSTTSSACMGDSGGPVILEKGPGKDLLLGINAFGPDGCNFYAKPGMTNFHFATSVIYFRKHLDAVIKAAAKLPK